MTKCILKDDVKNKSTYIKSKAIFQKLLRVTFWNNILR